MPIFLRKAIEAAVHPQAVDWLREDHLADWNGLAAALGRLTSEQQCDAIYADWLLRLNENRPLILPIRDYLIGQGALAANYLAELAQNAVDAADGKPASIRVVPDGEWLFVANNGRKVTSLNLLGLSRFFVHAAGQVIELNEKTIGRFGIGFKSCYRIASEVAVFTWDKHGRYGFRLPICRPGDEASAPDAERLAALLRKLEAVGAGRLDDEVQQIRCLGYCTPEFFASLPLTLEAKTANLLDFERGTLFAFRIRPDRRAEVAGRISGQAHEVYELCPLFLPNLQHVQLGPNALAMSVEEGRSENDPAVPIEADWVTLTTTAPGHPKSNSRFWRLRGLAHGDLWQVALHADGKRKLRLKPEADELGVTLKEGSAYAFFPLNGMNQAWGFRFHLHLKLPTKLERDNWNPDDCTAVEDQLRRAIRGIVEWLLTGFDSLVGVDWGFERLVEQRPSPPHNREDWPALWAKVVFDELQQAATNRPLLRTIGGRRVTAAEAKRVEIVKRQAAADAWTTLGAQPGLSEIFPAFVSQDAAVFGIEAATPDEVGEAFSRILRDQAFAPEVRQAAMLAYLSTTRHSGGSLERALKNAVVELADGTTASLGDLLAEPCGTNLQLGWHACFTRLSDWARDADWRSNQIFSQRVDAQFRKLAQPVFNPTWAQIPSALGTIDAWRKHGNEFWRNPRRPCPPQHRPSALTYLRVPDGQGGWLPIQNLWVDDDTPVDCFAGILAAWPLRYNDPTRARINESLSEWALLTEWNQTAKQMLEEKLPGEMARRLSDNANGDALQLVFTKAFQDSRRNLAGEWKYVVDEAEKTAVSRFIRARSEEGQLAGKTVLSSSIMVHTRSALTLIESLVSAPAWLSDTAHTRICALGLQQRLNFDFLSQRDVERDAERLAQLLLDGFYRWQNVEPNDPLLQGFQEVFGAVGVQRRRDLFIALSTQRRRRIREFFAAFAPGAESSTAERLMAERLARAVKHVEPLPPPLDQVPALREVAVHFGKLRCERETANEVLLQTEQVEAAVAQDSDLKALVDEKHPLYGASQGLRLKWFAGDDLVAELADADVGWFGGRLVFGQYAKPASEVQYVRLLALYELSDVVSGNYQMAQHRGASPFDLYKQFRDHIVEVLVKKHVKDVGYGREDILRELLQNAENAYDSQQKTVATPWFEFRVEPAERGGEYMVRVRHAGRVFNEPDRTGQPRPDIERIVKINAPNQNTDQELGRFNRGFKSVFTVAKDGTVRVRSGAHRFEIQDLLLLNPPEPKPEHAPQAETEFDFTASQADALGMVGFPSPPTGQVPPKALNMTSFLFLPKLRRTRIQWGTKFWEWQVAWHQLGQGWVRVEIKEATTNKSESFCVYSGRLPDKRRFGVAIRTGGEGTPRVLEKDWRSLRLTFETERTFGFDVLVNGDFEADQGRVNVTGLETSGADIIEASLDVALKRASDELERDFSPQRWVAWAKVLHLKDAREVFEAEFTTPPARFARWAEQLENLMSGRVPCTALPRALHSAEFPTRLMRRLAKDFAGRWSISTAAWIEHEVEEELPQRIRDQHTKFSLHKWISQQSPMSLVLEKVRSDFSQTAFEALKRSLGKPERDELAEAERILAEKLRPVEIINQPGRRVELPVIAKWSVGDLWHWWEQQGKPLEDYVLEGEKNWRLLQPDVATGSGSPRERLRADLLATESPQGKAMWYRLFGLACLMSAGRRMSEVRSFWTEELDGRDFWKRTSEAKFGQGTDALFAEVIARPFTNLAARGEHAYFWRRVFYDIRKIHKLVWEDDFATTLMDLVQKGHGQALLKFLRTGHLPGQQTWVGVFGQSAGAPLFFIIRELCRLEVITDKTVKPLAYFVSTPVRRAMERIGWLGTGSGGQVDFQRLASLSELLHAGISMDPVYGPQLSKYYDIPLLHLGLEG